MNGDLQNVDISSVNDYAPTSAKSFAEHSGMKYGGTNFWDKAFNFITGKTDKAKQDYEMYLQNLNTENAWKLNELNWKRELQATQSAREWDKMMSDTQYQRMVADLKAAGLNPWLALQNGVSGSSVPTSSKANASGGKSSNYGMKNGQNGMRDTSLLLFALARLLAA